MTRLHHHVTMSTSLPILLVCIVLSATCSSVQCYSRILYLRANATQCPPNVPKSQCQTLNWYSTNKNVSFISNTKMVFLDGLHFLNSFVTISNCSNFAMIGTKSHKIEGKPQLTSRIVCNEGVASGLSFVNSSKIYVANLALESCGGAITLKQDLRVSVALAFAQVINLTLHHVMINNSVGIGLYCYNCFGEIT